MSRYLRRGSIIATLVALAFVIWFVGDMLGFGDFWPLESRWARGGLIAAILGLTALVYGILWWRRRRAERALEDKVAIQAPGDAEVLGEKMSEALAVLRKASGSRAYLYDLPWYVIIGPPGAGKTTALLNSGIRFPLADKTGGAVPGAGGTRYCDWWFSDEAVLIDTAGRYTTQDSDAEADRESWMSLLGLLKEHRARQPINGVIVALSLQEVLTGGPEVLEREATAIRDRLVEIHEILKIDVPVYVLFTKADLIAGFTEYFGSFSASRRQKVWGATFRTRSRREPTVPLFAQEFDALVARLSEEVTDRLQEEPDGIARIAIFGFPAQLAMLKDRIGTLLNEIFASTRYRVGATLRGFYFSSGTQEGTPIDQVLGAMARSFGPMGAGAGAGMSGKGRSYFLHDLLRKVIFAEAGWVSTDRAAVRREAALRYGTLGVIGIATLVVLGIWGASFYQNRGLVRTAEAAFSQYRQNAASELQLSEIVDADLMPVLVDLEMLRDMPMGFGDPDAGRSGLERFGFSQRDEIHAAARASYLDALERSFRTRLILALEQQVIADMETADTVSLYESLKAYKLIGHAARGTRDDDFLREWFAQHWARVQYPGPAFRETRLRLEQHLDDLLRLTERQTESRFALNGTLIDRAEFELGRIPIEDQAYLLVSGGTPTIPDFNFAERAGSEARLVFETLDGRDLNELTVPAIYSYAGFHQFFLPRLSAVAEKLEAESWVLGDRAEQIDLQGQLGALGPAMLATYAKDFEDAWNAALGNLRLRPMSADAPGYAALGAASASGRLSPIYALAEAITQETRLTEDFGGEGSFGAGLNEASATGGLATAATDQLTRRLQQRATGMQRIGIDLALGAQGQGRGGSRGASAPLPGANIEARFTRWHNLFEGSAGQRPVDLLLANLRRIHQLLSTAALAPGQAADELPGQIGALKANASRLPEAMSRMILQAAQEFEGDAANTTLNQLNDRLNTEVTRVCEQIINNGYPFSANASRDVPIAEFARLFAAGGVMESFFEQHLAAHADVTTDPWSWRTESPLGDRLSLATLRQFQHADNIRTAFFPGDSSMPHFDITVSQTAMHADVQAAMLEINGQVITTRQAGNVPQTVGWPGAGGGGSASIQLSPEVRDGPSSISARVPGPWALMRLINEGRPRPSGTTVSVRYNIGGRYIAYDIRSQSTLNPFFLRSLWDFRCPRGL